MSICCSQYVCSMYLWSVPCLLCGAPHYRPTERLWFNSTISIYYIDVFRTEAPPCTVLFFLHVSPESPPIKRSVPAMKYHIWVNHHLKMKGVEDRGDITLYWKHLFSELRSSNNHWMYRGRAHDFIIWRPSIYLDIISNNYLRLLLWYAVLVYPAAFGNQPFEVCANLPHLWNYPPRVQGKRGQIINTEHMIILCKETFKPWCTYGVTIKQTTS